MSNTERLAPPSTAAAVVLHHLATAELSMTTDQLCAVTGYSRSTVGRALRSLGARLGHYHDGKRPTVYWINAGWITPEQAYGWAQQASAGELQRLRMIIDEQLTKAAP